jgi:hypothetical protein
MIIRVVDFDMHFLFIFGFKTKEKDYEMCNT